MPDTACTKIQLDPFSPIVFFAYSQIGSKYNPVRVCSTYVLRAAYSGTPVARVPGLCVLCMLRCIVLVRRSSRPARRTGCGRCVLHGEHRRRADTALVAWHWARLQWAAICGHAEARHRLSATASPDTLTWPPSRRRCERRCRGESSSATLPKPAGSIKQGMLRVPAVCVVLSGETQGGGHDRITCAGSTHADTRSPPPPHAWEHGLPMPRTRHTAHKHTHSTP